MGNTQDLTGVARGNIMETMELIAEIRSALWILGQLAMLALLVVFTVSVFTKG